MMKTKTSTTSSAIAALVLVGCRCAGSSPSPAPPSPTTAAASGTGAAASGGAQATSNRVSASGSYQTSVAVAVPEGPMAPSVSLVYDSGSGGGVAGVGWDLSVGWPMMISRDTRFGTPEWKKDSAWLWGSSPLVVQNPGSCGSSGTCA